MKLFPWKKPENCRPWAWWTFNTVVCLFSLLLVGFIIPGRILK